MALVNTLGGFARRGMVGLGATGRSASGRDLRRKMALGGIKGGWGSHLNAQAAQAERVAFRRGVRRASVVGGGGLVLEGLHRRRSSGLNGLSGGSSGSGQGMYGYY